MTRGRLRIYLGAAPGVGKTIAMLAEGGRRASRGTDVVVGLCETHDRPHTAELLTGLEVVPRVIRTYRGTTMTEMDLDAVLARDPQVALVDELAHTNVPGGRHEKRWQDIDDLLSAGIDVISTVNIQHLESLNDVVEAVTGITQRETVPDRVVRGADQIELVDMAPEALRRRMAHGNIYKAAQVDAALANYFRVGNLGALRELALLWLADRVEEGLDRYRLDHGIDATWPTRERVVVALSGGPEGEALLRRGARIASRGAGGELHAVHVSSTDGLAGPSAESLTASRRLTEELGGTFHTVTGDDIAPAILAFARGINAAQILLGATRRPPWRRTFTPGTGDVVIAGSGDIDVHVVTHDYARPRPGGAGRPALSRRRVVLGFAAALVGPSALTAVLDALPSAPGLPLISQIYLLLTVLTALLGGLWPALLAAVVSSLELNWFFTPPVGTFTIASPENAAALTLFLVVGAAVSFVVHRNVRRAAQAVSAEQESAALVELSQTLLGSTEQLTLLLRRAQEMFNAIGAAVLTHPTPEQPTAQVVAATDTWRPPGPDDVTTREPADDQHDLVLIGPPVPADRQRLLTAYAAHAGAILARRALQREASEADALSRDNRARTALLSAVSHDLRTPLAGIKAAIGSLRSTEVSFTPQDEDELKAAIEDSADRLEILIGNLLDMSRLQVGALVAHPRPIDLGEVIPAAVGSAAGSATRVQWSLGPRSRRAFADPGLLDRVLGNLVENALRYQPPNEPVRVVADRRDGRIEIRVVDTGPGVATQDRDAMFHPFQRYDDRTGQGVGLGLAVARGLAEAMGGTVEAEDTPGGGLTMTVSVPAAADPVDPQPQLLSVPLPLPEAAP